MSSVCVSWDGDGRNRLWFRFMRSPWRRVVRLACVNARNCRLARLSVVDQTTDRS